MSKEEDKNEELKQVSELLNMMKRVLGFDEPTRFLVEDRYAKAARALTFDENLDDRVKNKAPSLRVVDCEHDGKELMDYAEPFEQAQPAAKELVALHKKHTAALEEGFREWAARHPDVAKHCYVGITGGLCIDSGEGNISGKSFVSHVAGPYATPGMYLADARTMIEKAQFYNESMQVFSSVGVEPDEDGVAMDFKKSLSDMKNHAYLYLAMLVSIKSLLGTEQGEQLVKVLKEWAKYAEEKGHREEAEEMRATIKDVSDYCSGEIDGDEVERIRAIGRSVSIAFVENGRTMEQALAYYMKHKDEEQPDWDVIGAQVEED